jgi:hypothetical protein
MIINVSKEENLMKKLVLVLLIALALIVPALADARLDIGFIAPRGIGASAGGTTEISDAMASWPFIPIPEVGLYYQLDLSAIKIGLGARCFTALVESFAWPNAYAELDLGPVAIQGQIGGGLFVAFGALGSGSGTGAVFFPDLSAWLKLGKKGVLRLGVGAIGLYAPDTFGDDILFLMYLGGKAAIPL